MKKGKSIKTKVGLILIGIMMPLLIFILIFNFYTVYLLNERVAESKKARSKYFAIIWKQNLQICKVL